MKKTFCILFFVLLIIYVYADEVDATNEGIANASPGDFIIRPDGETVFLKQVDIDYAREKLGLNTFSTNQYQNNVRPSSNSSPSLFFPLFSVFVFIFVLVKLVTKKSRRRKYYPKNNNNIPYEYKPVINNESVPENELDNKFDNRIKSKIENKKTYIDQRGYRRFTDTDIPVHRYLAEKKLGRKLRHGEVVHHINRNKLDNSPENLQIFASQEEHDKVHKESGWY